MTGHGAAAAEDDSVRVLVEIRAVNNRYLKISISGELNAGFQAKIESLIRGRIQRGSVNVRVQTQSVGADSLFQINLPQLNSYQKQLEDQHQALIENGHLLTLPGVVVETLDQAEESSAWPVLEVAVNESLDRLGEMRAQEGEAMRADLLENCRSLENHANSVKVLAPSVIDGYTSRITERINRLLEQHNVSVTSSELIKEIGVFAERVDISEELVRLESHIEQFRAIANGSDSSGRKLDFLTQELLRETNTIGSKANHAEIANHVVEMKTVIERIREMIQNIE